MFPTEIRCSRSLLRPWRDSDRDSLVRNANDRDVWLNVRDRFAHPYTDVAAEMWLALAASAPPENGVWAIEVDGEAVGGMGLDPGRDVERFGWEIGYWIGRPFWGRGIVSEAVQAVTEAALRVPNVIRLHAGVFSWNPASMRVLEKAGYQREGVLQRAAVKDGTVVDVVVYGRVRDTGLPYRPFGK